MSRRELGLPKPWRGSQAYFNEGICVLEFFSEERQGGGKGEAGL